MSLSKLSKRQHFWEQRTYLKFKIEQRQQNNISLGNKEIVLSFLFPTFIITVYARLTLTKSFFLPLLSSLCSQSTSNVSNQITRRITHFAHVAISTPPTYLAVLYVEEATTRQRAQELHGRNENDLSSASDFTISNETHNGKVNGSQRKTNQTGHKETK